MGVYIEPTDVMVVVLNARDSRSLLLSEPQTHSLYAQKHPRSQRYVICFELRNDCPLFQYIVI